MLRVILYTIEACFSRRIYYEVQVYFEWRDVYQERYVEIVLSTMPEDQHVVQSIGRSVCSGHYGLYSTLVVSIAKSPVN